MNPFNNTTIDEYRQLADMNSRETCPKCEGFGYFHASSDKHDKPTSIRCRKCTSCHVCEGSGVTFGLVGCKRCHVRGFVHLPTAPKPHPNNVPSQVRCFDCMDCADCGGRGVIDIKKAQDIAREALIAKRKAAAGGSSSGGSLARSKATHQAVFRSTLPPMVPDMVFNVGSEPLPYELDPRLLHPHMHEVMGVPLGPEVEGAIQQLAAELRPPSPAKDTSSSVTGGADENNQNSLTLIDEASLKFDCPRCDGLGFRHESSAKHDKRKREKCKYCTLCKGCTGTGKVFNKRKCPQCETRGFVHLASEREHDVPDHLRCFFCKNCPTCSGLGLIDMIPNLTSRGQGLLAQKRQQR